MSTPDSRYPKTANDLFKQSFQARFWGSVIVATAIHFCAFVFWPELTAERISSTTSELETIEFPPEIKIPPPPQSIARPARPVMAEADISEDITIAMTTFEENPVAKFPPPPEEKDSVDLSANPIFTPYTVAPDMKNRKEVEQVLKREYPPLLRNAGIGGTVRVFFLIDEEGTVRDRRIDQSSGYPQLDEAALRVAEVAQFSPAVNRDHEVSVWISLPITFWVR